MADGAWLDPNINAWWLDRSSPNDAAAAAGFGRGMQIAQQRLEMAQQARREETATKFKMMDFALEAQRNEIALKTFQSKQSADLLRSKGMADIGEYLGNAVRNGQLLDPKVQAGFFDLTSRYAPFINEQTVNSMWDNTFGNAMRRDDAKNRILTGHDAPAVIQYQERLQKMEGELAAMSDPSSPTFNPDAVENKKKELERFRNASRLVTAEESGPMALAEFRAKEAEERATIRMAHEKEMAGVRAGSQKELQERRAKRSAMSAKLKVDLEDIDKKYDLDILSAFNDPNKKAKLQADKRSEQAAVWNKYNESFDNEDGSGVPSTPATTAPAAINKFRFDPSTYDIVK